MSDAELRKLNNLRVIDLRTELGKRNLDKTGVKNELIERLQKALISEGHDPEEYLFDVDSTDKKTPRSNKRRTMDENDVEKEENGINDSLVGEEDPKDAKDAEDTQETTVEKKTELIASNETPSDETPSNEEENVAERVESVSVVIEKLADPIVKPEKEADKNAVDSANVEDTKNEEKKEEIVGEIINNVDDAPKEERAPKEQRANVTKKNVNEELKEKPADTNKEDNEDSINLTIGEDEVKLFGEEEEASQEEAPVEKEAKENDQSSNTTTEAEKESQNDSSKNDQEAKQDPKAAAKKSIATKASGSSKNLWVSGLSSMTRATDLKALFSKYGKVVAAKIVTNAKTPGSRCYGYVTMLSPEDATVSMENLHKTELDGRLIFVERAKDDGTGPAKPKPMKKEAEKKKPVDSKDEKKPTDDKRKLMTTKTGEGDSKIEEKKDDAAVSSVKDADEDVNGESKASSIKSENISGNRAKRSRTKEGSRPRSKDRSKPRSTVLTFAQIKEERERHRLKEKERVLRIEERRRQIERERQREIERRQREEAVRLERERMKLKMEREKMKAELLKLEREAQRLERERLQREKEELRRAQMKLEETRRAVKRPLEITRTFEDDRKRRPPSPDRRHVHVSSSVTASRKEVPTRTTSDRRATPTEYTSRRGYESSVVESSRKDQSHAVRDKPSKESSRYDHHYQSSRSTDDVRTKDMRHRYPDPSSKSSTKDSGGRYERGAPSEGWSRSTSGNVSSSVKVYGSLSGGGSSSMSSRDAWSSSDRKAEQPPWMRSAVGSSTSERWSGSSTSASGMGMSRSGTMSSSSAMYSGSGSYSDSMQMGLMSVSSNPSYSDRFDAYSKSSLRKY